MHNLQNNPQNHIDRLDFLCYTNRHKDNSRFGKNIQLMIHTHMVEKAVDRMLEKTAIEYPAATISESDLKIVIPVPDAQSIMAETHVGSYSNVKGTENTVSHYISVFCHNLKKFISSIKRFGTGRIDEQRLTTRDPWLEVYRFRKDL